MVLGNPAIIRYALTHAYNIESATRTDGRFPLFQRLCDVLLNLDKQPNKMRKMYPSYGYVYSITVSYYTFYYLFNGKDAYIFNLSIQNDKHYNLKITHPTNTTVHYSNIPKSYKPYPDGGKYNNQVYEFVYRKHRKRGRIVTTYNVYNHINGEMLFDIDFDELIPISSYNDGIYGKGYYYGDNGWYKLYSNGYYEYIDSPEPNMESKQINKLVLKESDLRRIIRETLHLLMCG